MSTYVLVADGPPLYLPPPPPPQLLGGQPRSLPSERIRRLVAWNTTALTDSNLVQARHVDETLTFRAVARKGIRRPCASITRWSCCEHSYSSESAVCSRSLSYEDQVASSRVPGAGVACQPSAFLARAHSHPCQWVQSAHARHIPAPSCRPPHRLLGATIPTSGTLCFECSRSITLMASPVVGPGRNVIDDGQLPVQAPFSIRQTNPLANARRVNVANRIRVPFRSIVSVILWITTIILATGSNAILEGKSPSVEKCKRLADHSTNRPWTDAEKHVWHSTCESEIALLSTGNEKKAIRASVLNEILLLKYYRDHIGPRGVRIEGAKITDGKKALSDLDLSDGHFPWPLWLKNSKLDSLNLERSVADRDISLAGSEIASCLNLKDARIHGQLILNEIHVRCADLQRLYVGSSLSMANSKVFSNLDLSSAVVNGSYQVHALTIHQSDTIKETQTVPGLNMEKLTVSKMLSLRNTRVYGQLYLWELDCGLASLELDGLVYDSVRLNPIKPSNHSLGLLEALLECSWYRPIADLHLADWIDKSESHSFQPYSQLASVLHSGGQYMAADLIWVSGKFKAWLKDVRTSLSHHSISGAESKQSTNLSQVLAQLGKLLEIDVIVFPGIIILVLAIGGAVLTFVCREICRIRVWMSIPIVWVFSKVFRTIVTKQLVKEFKSAGQKLGEITINSDKMVKIDSKTYLNKIRTWGKSLDNDPVIRQRPVLRLISEWRIHNAGVKLWSFWILSLLPPKMRPESLTHRLCIRRTVPLKPLFLEIYHLVCWCVVAIIVAITLLIINARLLGQE